MTHLLGGRFLITFLVAGQRDNACTCSFSSVWFPQLEHKASIKLPFQKCGSLWKGRLLSPIPVVSHTPGCQEVEFQGEKLSKSFRSSWQPGCCSTARAAPCWGKLGLGKERRKEGTPVLLACLDTVSRVNPGTCGVLRCQSPVDLSSATARAALQIPRDSSRDSVSAWN